MGALALNRGAEQLFYSVALHAIVESINVYHTVAVVALVGCGSGSKPDPPPPAEPEPAPEPGEPDARCTPLDYAADIDIAEASGADVTPDGHGVLVIADSGRGGDYVIADVETGEIREGGSLPLGDGGDDLEGAAFAGDRLFALSSSGFVYAYRRAGSGFELTEPPYRIGPRQHHCGVRSGNCGANFEGLCLGERDLAIGAARCRGFAASKTRGSLICVTADGDRLTLRPETAIAVAPRRVLSGCAITGDRIWAVTNILGANSILEVSASGQVTPRLTMAPGSTEAVAARGDVVWRFSDTGDRPSLAGRYRCP